MSDVDPRNATVRRPSLLALTTASAALLAAPALAGPATLPDVIDLPDGFQPEGIAIGAGPTAYAGSLATGDIVEVDLRTGEVSPLVDADPDDVPSVGLDTSRDGSVVYAAGGPGGELRAYDTRTGDELADVTLPSSGGFVNDVVVTRDAAYLTNSNAAEYYRVPLDRAGVPTGEVSAVPLAGDFVLDTSPGAFNSNGIAATPDGGTLYLIQSSTGTLFRVPAGSSEAVAVEVDGLDDGALTAGDGVLLTSPRELLVVRNQLNTVSTVRLSPDGTGTVVDETTDEAFDVPTTVDVFGATPYVVNARFGTTMTPDTTYTMVRVD